MRISGFIAAGLATLLSSTAAFAATAGEVNISVEFPFGPLVTSRVIVGGAPVQYSTRLPGEKSWYEVSYDAKPTPAGNYVEILTSAKKITVKTDGGVAVSEIEPTTSFVPYGTHEEFDIPLKVDPKQPLEATGTVAARRSTT